MARKPLKRVALVPPRVKHMAALREARDLLARAEKLVRDAKISDPCYQTQIMRCLYGIGQGWAFADQIHSEMASEGKTGSTLS